MPFLVENLSGSHFCQAQHDPGVAEHGIGPVDPRGFLQHCKVFGAHFHVYLNRPLSMYLHTSCIVSSPFLCNVTNGILRIHISQRGSSTFGV
jgi:hypothetical protein